MSRCCRTSSIGTSISALIPRIPIVPSKLASQPGAAIVNCHGSLCVIVGGAASFGGSSSVPAFALPTAANTAPENKSNLIFTTGFYGHRSPNPKQILLSLISHDLGALEAKAGHQTLLIEGEGVDAAMQAIGRET